MFDFVHVCHSCQFVVRDGCDYSVHAVDPDTLVEWDHIEQVVSWHFSPAVDSAFVSERCDLLSRYQCGTWPLNNSALTVADDSVLG